MLLQHKKVCTKDGVYWLLENDIELRPEDWNGEVYIQGHKADEIINQTFKPIVYCHGSEVKLKGFEVK